MIAKKPRRKAGQNDQQKQAPTPDQDELEAEQAPKNVLEEETQAAEESQTPQDQREDLMARLQRVSADYLNYQKRVQREMADARDFANVELIRSLLPILDDMERALAVTREDNHQDDPLLAGMKLVHDKAIETLGKFGLVAIEALGKPFDPDRHSAMMQEPSAEHPPQTVMRELQKGYQMKGRLIRPTSVIVSKSPETAEDADGEIATEDDHA